MKNLSKALSILLCFALIATLFVGLGTIGASANEVQPLGKASRTNPIARSEANLKSMIHGEGVHQCCKEKLCESAYYENKALVVTNNIDNNGIYVHDGVNAHYLNIYSNSGILTNTNKYGDGRVTYVVKYKVKSIGEGGYAQIGIGTSAYIESSGSYTSWNWSKTDIHGVSEKHTEASDKEYSIVVTNPVPNTGAHERLVVAGQGCKIEVSYIGRLVTDQAKPDNTSVVRMVLPDGLTYAMLLQPGSDLGTNIKPWGASTSINADFYDAQGNKLSYLATTEDITVYVKYENGEHCHVYDNECADDECNICKEKREIVGAHIDADEDGICDVCGNNSGIELPEVPACTHETTKDANVVEPTYFKDGSKDVVCECGETVESGVVIPAATTALKGDFTTAFADGKLTISWIYSDALALDIFDGAKISFNYSIAGYSNTVKIASEQGADGASVTLEGFNAERLNGDFTFNLSADVDTANKLSAATATTVKASAIATDDKLTALLEALNSVEKAEVSGQVANTEWLVSNTAKLDIKAGTAQLRIVASQKLIDALSEYGKEGRTVKLIVKVGDITKTFTLEALYKVTLINVSGLSFDYLNGNMSAQLVIDYPETDKDITSAEITFNCGEIIANADTDVANAFAAYMN